jgi:tetratricopeptide (TPR) repeat protein
MPRLPVRTPSLFLLVLALLGTAAPAADLPDAGATPTPDAGATTPATAACEPELGEAQRAAVGGRFDEALVLARKRADTCPDARLLTGQLLAHQGQFDEASSFLERELVSTVHNPGAFDLLVHIFPKLSPARQEQVAALGASREAPIRIRGLAQADLWLTQVVCRERRIDKTDWKDVRAPGLGSFSFECPPGVPRRVFFYTETWGGSRPTPPPPSTGLSVERVLPDLGSRFGIHSVEELRESLEGPLSVDRSTSWLVTWLKDYPSQLSIMEQMLRRSPDDLEAAVDLSKSRFELGDLEGALQVLDAVALDSVSLKDTRSGVTGTSALFTVRCRVLLQQRKVKEAEEACRTSIERGSKKNGPHALALVLYLQGRDAEAVAFARSSLANTPQNPPVQFLYGLILQSLGEQDMAVKAWKAAADYGLTSTVESKRKRSREDWLRAIEAYEREQVAADLALCGHYYLDLRLPERSEACFARSESLRPGPAAAERLIHQAESDPRAALKAARALLRKGRHPALLHAIAFAHQRAGNPKEALRWLDESLAGDSGRPGARELLTRVCKELAQPRCLEQRRQGK